MLTTAQIGRAGELLVQSRLLRAGIESSQMTTDVGVDLVAFVPPHPPFTIQVKTTVGPHPAANNPRLAVGWNIAEDSPADYAAFVDLKSERIWLLPHCDLLDRAQQRRSGRQCTFFMFIEDDYKPGLGRRGKPRHYTDFEDCLLETQVARLFGPLPEPPLEAPVPVD